MTENGCLNIQTKSLKETILINNLKNEFQKSSGSDAKEFAVTHGPYKSQA